MPTLKEYVLFLICLAIHMNAGSKQLLHAFFFKLEDKSDASLVSTWFPSDCWFKEYVALDQSTTSKKQFINITLILW